MPLPSRTVLITHREKARVVRPSQGSCRKIGGASTRAAGEDPGGLWCPDPREWRHVQILL